MTEKVYQNILAVDTSSLYLRLALLFGGDRLVKSDEKMDKSHGQLIIKKINELFSSAGLAVRQLDALAVSTGPGSFTGLRIGLAVVKGIAVARDIPIVDINLFELAAFKLSERPEPVKVFVPFKKGEFFMAEVKNGEYLLENITVITESNFSEKVGGSPVAGINFNIIDHFPQAVTLPGLAEIGFDAADLVYLGRIKLEQGQKADLAGLEPLYLLRSQAEIKFEKLRKKK
ncbi:MAG: tRNA (adenosine(37)-N6)-threonylcarbamoyltransferase complex dimerization subunit type 1 TsaB [candidate division Zixibacteria bacterium]|nr:tRNA (adenosine(37)-N6)-threonylcarbamoyltransferase complex dimerization subunit type 1 TsaB [candidate division Zixibacteria bacterium]